MSGAGASGGSALGGPWSADGRCWLGERRCPGCCWTAWPRRGAQGGRGEGWLPRGPAANRARHRPSTRPAAPTAPAAASPPTPTPMLPPPLPPWPRSYAASDRSVVAQMSGVDAFGQLSAVALRVGGRAGGGEVWAGRQAWGPLQALRQPSGAAHPPVGPKAHKAAPLDILPCTPHTFAVFLTLRRSTCAPPPRAAGRWWSSTPTWRAPTWRPCTPPCCPSAAQVRGARVGWGGGCAAVRAAGGRRLRGRAAPLLRAPSHCCEQSRPCPAHGPLTPPPFQPPCPPLQSTRASWSTWTECCRPATT